jgi:hypothetical protein
MFLIRISINLGDSEVYVKRMLLLRGPLIDARIVVNESPQEMKRLIRFTACTCVFTVLPVTQLKLKAVCCLGTWTKVRHAIFGLGESKNKNGKFLFA